MISTILIACLFSLASIFTGVADPIIMYIVGLILGAVVYAVRKEGLKWFKEFI